MTIDPYSPCPGGTGKKIKFCCSDLVHELDKLQRMVDGDQRVAALDYVSKLDEKYPGRACLLSTRAMLETVLGKSEQSAATLATFREKHPQNPIALAELAVLQASGDKPLEAIATLEKALELCAQELPAALYEAYGSVAEQLAGLAHYPAAQALFWFQVSLSAGEDKHTLQHWAALESEPGIPLLLKLPRDLVPTPPAAPWKYEFDIALEKARNGQWHAAAGKFAALTPIAGKSPALWQNLGRLRAWIGDYAGSAEAFRKIAALDVPLDDAVEAEATAITLETHWRALNTADRPPNPADQLRLTFAVGDQAELEERLAADRRINRLPIDPQLWREATPEIADDEPPPRAAYLLLDRPLPASPDAPREAIPYILATTFLFGRQTDRPERIELVCMRSDIAAARELLSEIAGDTLGDATETVMARSHLREARARQMRFPVGISPERRFEVEMQELTDWLLEVWPETPQADLNGQTPRQAASDPGLRIRVMAMVLLMDLTANLDRSDGLTDRLRERLGIPIPAPIDPKTVNLAELPRARLARLQADKFSDEELLQSYRRAKLPQQPRALESLAKEIVGRASLAGRNEVVEAYGMLFSAAKDSNAGLAIIDQARVAAQRAKQSTASWDLAELRLRFERGEAQEVSRVMTHLQREHAREPGVGEAFMQLLYELGLIDEHGQRIVRSEPQASPIIVPGAAEPGKILVPGGDTAPAAGGASKPVIWTPGM